MDSYSLCFLEASDVAGCCRGLSPRGGRLLASSSEDISIYGPLTNHTVFRLHCQRPDIAPEHTITPAELASGTFTNTQQRHLTSRCSLPLHGLCPDFSSPASHPAPPVFTSLFIIFFTLSRSFWSLRTQETYTGIINSGEVSTLAQPRPRALEFLVSSCSFL